MKLFSYFYNTISIIKCLYFLKIDLEVYGFRRVGCTQQIPCLTVFLKEIYYILYSSFPHKWGNEHFDSSLRSLRPVQSKILIYLYFNKNKIQVYGLI